MKSHTYIGYILFIFIFLVSVFINNSVSSTSNSEAKFKSAYKEAQNMGTKAASAGNQWRDTGKLLQKAKKAATDGQFDQALKLANKASNQYKMAIEQASSHEKSLKNVPFYNPNTTPEEDVKLIQAFFRDKFNELPDTEFANGFYAMDATMRVNWVAIEEFPPYEPAIEDGKTYWNTAFKNGKDYSDCFNNPDILTDYPRWDRKAGEVVTLPMAINKCRVEHGEKALKYSKSEMLALQAYIAFESRGNPTNVLVPPDDPRALEAYNQGKKFYFSRRGQINLACYHCHFENAGKRIRANVLGPALGQTTHWPTYRSKWGNMGSLHRRYKGCNKQVRAKPFDLQSVEYRNLEYFHTFISNGIPTNGPGTRF